MHRMTVGSALAVLGPALIITALFGDTQSTRGQYDFGWEQKAVVVIGCGALWLACIVWSGWTPRHRAGGETLGGLRVALERVLAKSSQSTWYELSETPAVRRLGVVQAAVILATAVAVIAFTSAPWFVALLGGLALSVGVNLAVMRFSRSALNRDRGRRSRRR